MSISEIRVNKVTRLFGATAALRDVSLIFRGATISFLEGANGAGKSTLLALIGTALRPSSGSIVYGPGRLNTRAVRAELGWVGHESRCYQELTGQQNVELAARIYGIDPALAWARAEERLGIGAFAKRAVSTMSRGQQQRIALGRALVHDPSVLLMDEPWSGLDSKGCEHLDDVLRQERDRGTLVIVVTHTPDAAERLGGARVRLERGRVVDHEIG